MKNIAIVGAGIIGRLIALSLNRQGYQVTLIDKDDKNGKQSAAYAAAGLLTPLGESLHCEKNIVDMGFESIKLWPKLLNSLEEYTFFQQQGSLMVSHEQDQGDFIRFARHLKSNFAPRQALTIDRQQLLELEPEIGRSFKQALFLPEEGQIGNRKLMVALQFQLSKEQVNWLDYCKVTAIENISLPQKGCRVTYKNEQKIHQQTFDLVIDCRGAGAKEGGQANAALTDLRAVRGELFQLLAPDVNISRPIRLMHPRYQLYIAPKGKGYYVVGATEIESDDTGPMTVRSAMELLSAAYSVHPGFAEAQIRQHVTQCRPAFSDNQPKIMVNQQLIQVNGLYRHGYLISPVLHQQVLALVEHFSTADTNSHCENIPYAQLNKISYTNEHHINKHYPNEDYTHEHIH